MSVVDSDVSFKQFGVSFQKMILQALLSDFSWAQQMMEVVKSDYFEQKHLKYLFEIYSKYYTTYKTFPSIPLLATMARDDLREGNDEVMCAQVVTYLSSIKADSNANDLPYVKDRALNFCKNQALKEALEAAVDLTREERYEEIVGRIKQAITVGTPNTTGHDFFEDIDARFVKEDRSVVPTGIKQLDAREIMNGGLGKGELFCVMAPTSVGKSHMLVQLGANAMRAGKNVLHYTFELRENKVATRYDSNFTNISATDVPDEKELVSKKLGEMRSSLGRLIIKEYPTNTATIMTLKSHIEKIAITKNFRPDIIIVDYADIMRSTRQFDSLRHELKLVYEELRGLAMEMGIPVATASQTNRESTESDVVGLDKMSESFGKAMVCDVIISMSRKPMQKSKGLCNIFVAKNRLGKDGILFPAKIDTARSIIEILDHEIDLEEYQKTNDNDMKQLLRKKWDEVSNERAIELTSVEIGRGE